MKKPTDQLIARLAGELTPSRTLRHPALVATSWLLASLAYVGLAMVLMGPLRPGVADQLLTPRFGLEIALALAAIGFGVTHVLQLSLPDRQHRLTGMLASIALTGWIGLILYGFLDPSLEPSMLGKRPHCATEAFIYSIPPLVALLVLVNRRYALARHRTLSWAAIVCALLPAAGMQIACMYDPAHAMQFHIGPAFGLVATVAVGSVLHTHLRRRQA